MAILALALSGERFVGASALLAQLSAAAVVGGTPTSLDLDVSANLPRADLPDGPVPIRMLVRDALTPTDVGEILVWVTNGYLSGLEYAWFSDDQPTAWPPPDRLVIVGA